jgi:hypothetical protein
MIWGLGDIDDMYDLAGLYDVMYLSEYLRGIVVWTIWMVWTIWTITRFGWYGQIGRDYVNNTLQQLNESMIFGKSDFGILGM